jgi:soluble lytic murein transglycosylase-like protein
VPPVREPYRQRPWSQDQTALIASGREPYGRDQETQYLYGTGRYGSDEYDDDRYGSDERDDEFDFDEKRRPWYLSKSSIAVAVAAALVLVLGTSVWLILRPSTPTRQLADPATDGSSGLVAPGDSVSPSATTAAPTVPATPKPAAKRTTAKPRPTPTVKPPAAQLPPPPPQPVPTSSSCTQHPGPDASHSAVSTALANAGQKNYWSGVQPPVGVVPPMPTFSVDPRLMDAFAWTESSWRSTVIACDGGIGLMQLMPDNVTFLNQRFGFDPALDVHDLNGNAELGAAYIEWLTMYFGTYYFGSYDLMNATAPIATGGGTLSLLDVVIAAYNVGPAALENNNGTPNVNDTLSIPNTGYVNRVTSAYASQPWLTA